MAARTASHYFLAGGVVGAGAAAFGAAAFGSAFFFGGGGVVRQ